MRIFYIAPEGWQYKLHHELAKIHDMVDSDPDVILCMSITQWPKAEFFHKKYPQAKIIHYNWDIYNWVWDRPRSGEYDYHAYVEALKQADDVWVPSETEQRRSTALGIESHVIKTYTLVFDLEEKKPEYVFNPLRELPDEHWPWAQKACAQLGIPYVGSDRNLTFEQYKNILAGAKFLISPNLEASTGGLSLLEGYYNGIPSLINGNGQNGGKDYFGDRAYYFTDFDSLKSMLMSLWNEPPVFKGPSRVGQKRWVLDSYSPEATARQVDDRLVELQRKWSGA